ncbi:hypothetical protein AYI70_g4191 [Smittium culicis]|uniref:Uncharacterized protein n=1 Tax=Smittium culicis TaxID=133412 RepID=A0A1R1Y0J3_9FUNG|nr:hypothetical protein AYI70_g4191 [Smittium culicis]
MRPLHFKGSIPQKIKLFDEEISGSSQDLVRLALHYAQNWENLRRASVCKSSGYGKDIATAEPGTESMSSNTCSISVFWKKKMEIRIMPSSNVKPLMQALSSNPRDSYPLRFHNQYQPCQGSLNYWGASKLDG